MNYHPVSPSRPGQMINRKCKGPVKHIRLLLDFACFDNSLVTVAEDISPPPLPTPAYFADVYLNELDTDKIEEEDDQQCCW